jgi:tetratricopeptide (TPR) repeat protein
MGILQALVDWDWKGAEASHRRCVELDPDFWLGHTHYGLLLSAIGRHEEAIEEVRRGLNLEPLTLVASHHFAWVSIRAGRLSEAAAQCRVALDLDPHFAMGHYWMGVACELLGKYDEAIPHLEDGAKNAGNSFVWLQLARTYALAGRESDARRVLADMHREADENYADPYGFAVAYTALGEVDQAFHWMERAAQDHAGMFVMWVNGDPRTASLREDPRMKEILGRMGLSGAGAAARV